MWLVAIILDSAALDHLFLVWFQINYCFIIVLFCYSLTGFMILTWISFIHFISFEDRLRRKRWQNFVLILLENKEKLLPFFEYIPTWYAFSTYFLIFTVIF